MRQKLFVALLVLITAAYCWGLGWIAWGFVQVDSALGYGLALGIVILLACCSPASPARPASSSCWR